MKRPRLFGILLVGLRESIAFRSDYLLVLLAGVLPITIQVFLWRAVFIGQDTVGTYTLGSMITYLLVAQSVALFTKMDEIEIRIQDDVQSGLICSLLLLPVSYLLYSALRRVGASLSIAVMAVPLILLPVLLGLVPPPGLMRTALFLVSVGMAVFISASISSLIGSAALRIRNISGLSAAKGLIQTICSGALFPLSLLPANVSSIMEYLPFKAIVYYPASIYTGSLPNSEVFVILGIQVFWLATISFAAMLSFRFTSRDVESFGG